MELAEHPRIQIGQEYVVTHITVDPAGATFGIVDDTGERCGQWPAVMFETVSATIPSNWTSAVDEDGWLAIAPAEWLVPGFWGDEYSATPISREQRLTFIEHYRRELAVILAES